MHNYGGLYLTASYTV